jgi:hypothetical protein
MDLSQELAVLALIPPVGDSPSKIERVAPKGLPLKRVDAQALVALVGHKNFISADEDPVRVT